MGRMSPDSADKAASLNVAAGLLDEGDLKRIEQRDGHAKALWENRRTDRSAGIP
jgi:hypothetical protein